MSAACDLLFEPNVRVPMRDGIHLAVDVYRPARDGRYPVILERTPYGRNETSRSERTAANAQPMTRAEVAAAFVSRGFVMIYQDCRGRHGSEGEFVKYLSDGADGFDTCAWVVQQPWCNGKIGTMGLSYAAHTQAALGCMDPPGLAAMVLDSGGFSNAYQGGIRQGGAFELKQVTWAHSNALASAAVQNDPARLAAMQATDLRGWFSRMPWTRGHSPLTPAPDYEAYVFDQWEHGRFDEYWKQAGLFAEGFYDGFSDVPMVHVSSWFDPYSRTATDNFMGLSRRKAGPVHLILGPWTHGDRSLTYAGDVDFGPAATLDGQIAPDWLAWRLRWFGVWLQGEQSEADEPPVRVFVMGGGSGRRNADGRLDHGGRWRSAAGWPLPGTVNVSFYLHHAGALSPAMPGEGIAPLSYAFDPNHPVPTIGGAVTSGEPVMRGGAYDQREGPHVFGSREPYLPLAARPDVLVFETLPLEADIEVIGPITAHLWVASDCRDTDFTIKLIDVHPPNEDYPEGFAMNLTDGILRCRYRTSWEAPSPVTPGEVMQILVAAYPTANLFKAGHRIRLDMSSSNFPRFDVNPNTGAPEGQGHDTRVSLNQVFLDQARPSHVVLPIAAGAGRTS